MKGFMGKEKGWGKEIDSPGIKHKTIFIILLKYKGFSNVLLIKKHLSPLNG
jgi:hypothetical protein